MGRRGEGENSTIHGWSSRKKSNPINALYGNLKGNPPPPRYLRQFEKKGGKRKQEEVGKLKEIEKSENLKNLKKKQKATLSAVIDVELEG